MNKFIYSS